MSIKQIIKSFINTNSNNIDINIDLDLNSFINEILNKYKNTNNYLNNKNLIDVNNELLYILNNNELFYNKLKNNYRLVNNIQDLYVGKYIRWFILIKNNNIENLKLSKGGFVINIKLNYDNNHKILCKIGKNYINIIFENTIVFQKLSLEEIIILELNNNITT